jgi:hypoxanthine phosphoribosyltransferase
MLAITRGGMVPAGMLAYRLGIRDILVAAVAYYDDTGTPGPKPIFLQFPSDVLLHGRRLLIVDEVWDSGATIHAVTERTRAAGSTDDRGAPLQARRSRVAAVPDHFAVSTDASRVPVQGRSLTGGSAPAERRDPDAGDRRVVLFELSEPRVAR